MVVITVTITLSIFTLLTAMRLERGAIKQEKAVSELAWAQASKQLRLQGNLIAAELQRMKKETADAAALVASREETANDLARGNIVAIDLLLQRAVENSPINGIIAFDAGLNALGSHKPGLVLGRVNEVFSKSKLYAAALGLVSGNDRSNPKSLTRFEPMSRETLLTYGLDSNGGMLEVVSMHPVFDEFGDVTALLLAHRLIGANDPVLKRFAQSEKLGIRILQDDKVLLNANIDATRHALPATFTVGVMGKTQSGAFLYHCSNFSFDWQLCVYEPISFLTEMVEQLVKFIKTEKLASMIWLAILALASVVVATWATSFATGRVMAPLRQITSAVRSVAKGNWMVHVSGQRRLDEVGDIARSVAVLQDSMKERERLKADVGDVERLKARRKEMDEASQRCKTALRKRLFSLSDVVENIDADVKKIAALVDLAEGEADEARLVANRENTKLASLAKRTGTHGSKEFSDTAPDVVSDTIDRLGETVAQLATQSKGLTSSALSMSRELSKTDQVVRDFIIALGDRDARAAMEETDLLSAHEKV